jgi:heme/copper-type cytochrome/quinol oxidase subunit 1
MHWLGFAGMPRRIPDYPLLSLVGILYVAETYVGVSLIVFFIVVAEAFIVARPAPRNPWPDLGQTTAVYSLEWLLTSPMDIHIVNFL